VCVCVCVCVCACVRVCVCMLSQGSWVLLLQIKARNDDYARIDRELFRLMCPKIAATLPKQSSMSLMLGIGPDASKVAPAPAPTMDQTFPPAKAGGRVEPSVSAHFDRVFWFGDFNYRIENTREYVDGKLGEKSEQALQSLLEDDQLLAQMAGQAVFKGCKEPMIHFAPSYKYDKGTDTYDTGKKMRVQAWTDRILFRTPADNPDCIRCTNYDAVMDIRLSDHKPVVAHFEVHVPTEDKGTTKVGRQAMKKGSSACAIL